MDEKSVWRSGENLVKESSRYLMVRMRAPDLQRTGLEGGSLREMGGDPR